MANMLYNHIDENEFELLSHYSLSNQNSWKGFKFFTPLRYVLSSSLATNKLQTMIRIKQKRRQKKDMKKHKHLCPGLETVPSIPFPKIT